MYKVTCKVTCKQLAEINIFLRIIIKKKIQYSKTRKKLRTFNFSVIGAINIARQFTRSDLHFKIIKSIVYIKELSI